MRKQYLSIFISIVLLGSLLGVYYFTKNRQAAKAQEELAQTSESPKPTQAAILEKTKEDVKTATFTSQNGSFTFLPKENKDENDKANWVLEGYETLSLNNSEIDSMMTSTYYLSPSEKLVDQAADPKEYGLDVPLATVSAEYADGSAISFSLGKPTPTNDYYYIKLENDPAVYLLNQITAKRFLNGYAQIIDKTIPLIQAEALTYALIEETDKQTVEFAFDGNKDEMQKELESYGMVSLTMKQPYLGRQLYLSNFQDNVLKDLSAMALDDIVEINPSDLTQYGLDTPALTIILEDGSNKLYLTVGKEASEEKVYVKEASKPYVATMLKSSLALYQNINVFKFIDRFVALVNIDHVDSIEVSSIEKNRTHQLVLNHDVIKATKEGESDEKIIKPTVDGKQVQESAFKTYYQTLIGLSYDAEIPLFIPDTQPLFTAVYKLNTDKEDIVAKFYKYNDSFYAVQRDNNPIQFVVNKQSVDIMFQYMDNLLAGKLDK